VCDFTMSTGTSKYSQTRFWMYSIEISLEEFFTKFFSICLARFRSISLRFRVDCASRDTMAPSDLNQVLDVFHRDLLGRILYEILQHLLGQVQVDLLAVQGRLCQQGHHGAF